MQDLIDRRARHEAHSAPWGVILSALNIVKKNFLPLQTGHSNLFLSMTAASLVMTSYTITFCVRETIYCGLLLCLKSSLAEIEHPCITVIRSFIYTKPEPCYILILIGRNAGRSST